MKKGDIVFIKGASLISKIITKIDKQSNGEDGKFSHVAIAISDKHIIEAEYSSKVSVVNVWKNIDRFKHFKIVDLKISSERRDMMYQQSMTYLGNSYDFLQLIGIILKKMFGINIPNNKNKFICSELVVSTMMEVGLLDGYDTEELLYMTPNELYEFLEGYTKQ